MQTFSNLKNWLRTVKDQWHEFFLCLTQTHECCGFCCVRLCIITPHSVLTTHYSSQSLLHTSHCTKTSLFLAWASPLECVCTHRTENLKIPDYFAYQGIPLGFCFVMPQGEEQSLASSEASGQLPLRHQDVYVFSSSSHSVSYDSCKQRASSSTSQYSK